MDNISRLNNCSSIFQVLGLQCFSLKFVDDKKEAKYPSIRFTIYLAFISIAITVINCVYFHIVNTEHVFAESIEENNLVYVTKISLAILQVAVGTVTLLSTYFKNYRLKQFFTNSEKIVKIYLRDLSYKVSYAKLNAHFKLMIFISVVLFSIWIMIGISMFRKSRIEDSLGFLIFILPLLFHLMMHVRFYFYVMIVNFHVKILKIWILRNFENDRVGHDFIVSWKVLPQRSSREVLAWKKIYILLKEMAGDVNDSMGLTSLGLISIIIINITRFGYQLYMITVGSSDVDIRKLQILKIFL